MTKEVVTLDAVKQDLTKIIKRQRVNRLRWHGPHALAFLLLIPIASILFGNILWGLLFLLPLLYQVARFLIFDLTDYRAKKCGIDALTSLDQLAISIEKLRDIENNLIYEPHGKAFTKTILLYRFESGATWRLPDVYKHYEWSREFYVSNRGLSNISPVGTEFIFVALRGYRDLAYIYPCKSFEINRDITSN